MRAAAPDRTSSRAGSLLQVVRRTHILCSTHSRCRSELARENFQCAAPIQPYTYQFCQWTTPGLSSKLKHTPITEENPVMSHSLPNILCRYSYDPLDRLASAGASRRFYQQAHLVTELDDLEQRSILRHGAQPLAQQNAAGETRLLATDRGHSPLLALNESLLQHIRYTSYGYAPAESGLSRLLGFNGECPERVTGHYLLGQGNRAFNPVLMRFNSPDELSPFGEGGMNTYAYCGGDPINFQDPTGNIYGPMAKSMMKISSMANILKHGKPTFQNALKRLQNSPSRASKTAARTTASTSTSTPIASRNPPSSQQGSIAQAASAAEELVPKLRVTNTHTPGPNQSKRLKNLLADSQAFDRYMSHNPEFAPTAPKPRVTTLQAVKNKYENLPPNSMSRTDINALDQKYRRLEMEMKAYLLKHKIPSAWVRST